MRRRGQSSSLLIFKYKFPLILLVSFYLHPPVVFVSAPLTVNPLNTAAVVGSSVTVIYCSSSLPDPVDWWWVPAGETELKPIYQSDTLVYLYDYHMEVKRGKTGQQDLYIYNITFKDAGRYTCFDEGRLQTPVDKGFFASAELVVIGRDLTCTHNISEDGILGGDICGLGLEPDVINMTCGVRYSGNVAPTLSWRLNTSDIPSHSSTHTIPYSRSTSTVIRQATEQMNGSQFTCSAGMLWESTNESSDLSNINWTSIILHTLWFSINKTEEMFSTEVPCSQTTATCSVSASESILETCEYKWSQADTRMVLMAPVLEHKAFRSSQGLFVCDVTCRVRRRLCHVSPVMINSTACSDNLPLPGSTTTAVPDQNKMALISPYITVIAILSSLLIILFALYVALIVTYVKIRRMKQKSNHPRENHPWANIAKVESVPLT